MLNNHYSTTVKYVQLDNAPEFTDEGINKFFREQGIQRRSTIPYAHPRNAAIERYNRIIQERARVLLISAQLPPSFRAAALQTAVYLENRLTTRALPGQLHHIKCSLKGFIKCSRNVDVQFLLTHFEVYGSLLQHRKTHWQYVICAIATLACTSIIIVKQHQRILYINICIGPFWAHWPPGDILKHSFATYGDCEYAVLVVPPKANGFQLLSYFERIPTRPYSDAEQALFLSAYWCPPSLCLNLVKPEHRQNPSSRCGGLQGATHSPIYPEKVSFS
ncbi:hypothetical protein SeMB42_g03920 [Synchytrium endobioticum]|uniref:Integrase catalytic domain-containing protein n=1 Tax=Synchytrium endobioticum TaxID=286115 RepID=A0A507D2F3_9FUNG|nr:hypothetical protein SeMB42_g03920 [Synchytrium endobioticum]